MYFYDLEGVNVVKYEVNLDINKLNQIKREIINNCSIIEHKSYETTNPIIKFESPYMKNYKSEKTNKKDFKTKKQIYIVSYDLYNYPYLVKLINELLLGNTSVIDEIKNYKENFSIEEPSINKEYNRLLSLLEKEDIKIVGAQESEEEKQKRIHNLKKLEILLTNYQQEKVLYSKNNNIEEYKLKVLECIKLKKINSISLEVFLDMQNFFNDSTPQNLHNTLKKII